MNLNARKPGARWKSGDRVQMIKVAVDARPLAYQHTGIGVYTANILQRLADTGAIDLVLYFTTPGPAIEFARCRHVSIGAFPNAIAAQLAFTKWAREDEVDVFWSPRHHLPLAVACRTVVTIHDMVWRQVPKTMKRGGRVLESILMPPSLRKADAIICVSEATRKDVVNFLPQCQTKSHVIYEAANVYPEHGGKMEQTVSDEPYFLFVGTKEPRKNLHRLLEAWRRSHAPTQGYKLVLAGGAGWGTDLSAVISRLRLQDSVHDVTPEVGTLQSLYQNCYAVLMPSLYEGFGIPLVEAMAFAKPVITSACSAMGEIVGDAGMTIDPYSVDEVATAINRLIGDKPQYHKLAAASAQRSEIYCWDRAATQTLNVIERVAAA